MGKKTVARDDHRGTGGEGKLRGNKLCGSPVAAVLAFALAVEKTTQDCSYMENQHFILFYLDL